MSGEGSDTPMSEASGKKPDAGEIESTIEKRYVALDCLRARVEEAVKHHHGHIPRPQSGHRGLVLCGYMLWVHQGVACFFPCCQTSLEVRHLPPGHAAKNSH